MTTIMSILYNIYELDGKECNMIENIYPFTTSQIYEMKFA